VSFTAVAGGLIPPDTVLPITAGTSLGTYLIGVSTSSSSDNSQAKADYGIWGTEKPLYQCTQSVLLLNQSIVSFATLSLVDASYGIWGADSRILPNATLNTKYRFELPAASLDDGFGNNRTYS
jgi:hypothetical protein